MSRTRSRRPTLVDELMNEVTFYGGLPMRRCDVFTLCTEHLGDEAKRCELYGADYFAFRPAAAPAHVTPLPLETARRICDGTGTLDDGKAFAAACGFVKVSP